MARRRRSYFRRRRTTRRSMRRSRRGSTGPKGLLGRALHTVTHRPLKVVAASLGIAAAGEIVLSGSSTGDGVNAIGHVMNAINAAGTGDAKDLAFNVSAIPRDIGAGVMNGAWVGPAIGAIVTGYVSRRFRL